MCKFFSLLSSGDGRVYYFSPEQRIAGVKMPDGGKCRFDSHASIAGFYGLDEDECNKWEYNPFSRELVIDMQLTANDRKAVLEEVAKIDFSLVCGDIEGAREFIRHLKVMKFLDGHGDVPDGVKMFETMEEAYDAARDAARNGATNAARDTARDAVMGAVMGAAEDAVMGVAENYARDAAGNVVMSFIRADARDATGDAALFIQLIYVCSGLPIDQKHIDYIKKRWSIWEAGYGVLCEIGRILYCYKKA